MKFKYFLFSFIAAAFLSSAIGADKALEVGKNAPKIETIDGTNVVTDDISSEKSKIISFWNPKKPASRIANRELTLKYGNNSQDKIEFISICSDSDEKLMKEVMKIDGVSSQHNLAYSQIPSRVFKDYDAEQNPRAFLISADGKILNIF